MKRFALGAWRKICSFHGGKRPECDRPAEASDHDAMPILADGSNSHRVCLRCLWFRFGDQVAGLWSCSMQCRPAGMARKRKTENCSCLIEKCR
ncbi:hypothetical protein VTI74DRAFT_5291 [Chaetomium olivicolor]